MTTQPEQFVSLFCPPIKKHPEPPKDVSPCTKENCPKCGQEMWVSEKKKAIYLLAVEMNKTTLFCCYDCFIRTAKEKTKSGEWNFDNIRKITI